MQKYSYFKWIILAQAHFIIIDIIIRLIDNKGGIYPNTRVSHVLLTNVIMCGNKYYLYLLTVLLKVKLWDFPLR